ncbi:class I SAM-dependent methyltransferase [Sanguibacter suaedae]|uniref:Methyltransferase domain-containing protein n=1 Tax=Sanguibacter suaedae TaxID=2795737 RepID=A0A934I3T6_9MICO|nr:class I SAM-dependent methyltransferase [Sanguibacter suaedae]MBI9113716.1 methyltransferase domain-containing protein [Sanguibacter suaedae]
MGHTDHGTLDDHTPDDRTHGTPEEFGEEFWDERYASTRSVWSGNPNPHLVTETAHLTPGRAVDVGAGEGADAIWLAQRGWTVTGVDHSRVGLDKAAAHAAQAGPDVAARIRWEHADVTTWDPGPDAFDLVTAHFMHLPSVVRDPLFERLVRTVAPGGTLLVVGHALADRKTALRGHFDPDFFWTGAQVRALLDPERWVVETDSEPGRTVVHDGEEMHVGDTVVRARRVR